MGQSWGGIFCHRRIGVPADTAEGFVSLTVRSSCSLLSVEQLLAELIQSTKHPLNSCRSASIETLNQMKSYSLDGLQGHQTKPAASWTTVDGPADSRLWSGCPGPTLDFRNCGEILYTILTALHRHAPAVWFSYLLLLGLSASP